MPRIVTHPYSINFSVTTSGIVLLTAAIFWAYGTLPLVCLIGLMLLTPALYSLQKLTGFTAVILWLFSLCLGFFIATYRPAGFDYPLVHRFSSLGFDLHLNIAKMLAGYLLLTWLWQRHTRKGITLSLAICIFSSIALIAMAWWLFNYQWEPKWPAGIWWFFAVNLGATVIAEEAFFRLMLQSSLVRITGSGAVAVLLSTAVFVAAHNPEGLYAALLLGAAGLTYALVYAYTHRFSAAVTTHFAVNMLHFTLLNYP